MFIVHMSLYLVSSSATCAKQADMVCSSFIFRKKLRSVDISHAELQKLFDTIVPENFKIVITSFIGKVVSLEGKYSCKDLWIADQMLGGIGGYCMPVNPAYNPYPSGQKRTLYRPLQYARSEMEICDVRMHARYVIQMCGMHLESVCRLYLQNRKTFGSLRFGNTTLGKAVRQMQSIQEINPATIDGLFAYVSVYNRSKHEINQDDSRERLFNAYDAVVGYYSARILGLTVLRILNVDESIGCYKIME